MAFEDGHGTQGFNLVFGATTLTGGKFNVTGWTQQLWFTRLTWTWVAAVGEHLQLFPITLTIPADHLTQNIVFDVPFDYPSRVQWSSGTFEVAITTALSSYLLYNNQLDYRIDMTIAKWNGTGYGYSGDNTHYILANNAIFGTNCPFIDVSGTNVVKIWAGGFANTVIRSYLIFHKVSWTGFTTAIAEVRDSGTGISFPDLTDATYNIPLGSTATNIFGIQTFSFVATGSGYTN